MKGTYSLSPLSIFKVQVIARKQLQNKCTSVLLTLRLWMGRSLSSLQAI